MAYATTSAGSKVVTSGTVGGDGEIPHGTASAISAIKAGSNVTLTSAGSIVTIASTGGGGSGNTLDAAYDQGGSGSGRTITVDNGAVVLDAVGSIDEILRIDSNHADNKPIVAAKDNDVVFSVGNYTNGSILGLRGNLQKIHEVTSQPITLIDPTAMDIMCTREGNHQSTAKGTSSALVGGRSNKIGLETGQPESSDVTGQPLGQNSVRATDAIIVGGNLNSIQSQDNAGVAHNCSIFGGYRNEILDDPTGRATIGFDTNMERSAILSGGTGVITNAYDSMVIGGINNGIVNQSFATIIGSESCSISSATGSAGVGAYNTIIASQSSTIATKLENALSGDESSNFGKTIAAIASRSASVTEDPKDCLLVGDGPTATKNTTTGDRDLSCIILGGGGTDIDDTHTNSNAIALVGNSYSTVGGALGVGYADLGWVATGADFAEYFEWNDGNPNEEDRVGLFVKLSTNDSGVPNGKIEVGGENTIGPVSAMPGFASNATPLNWSGKWQKDDFGRFVFDNDGNRVLNPNFDADAQYRAREARKEWSPIGMTGRLRVKASSNIGIYPSNKSGLTVNVNVDGTVSDAGAKGKYKVIQVVKQKEIWSGPEGVFRRRRQIQDHGHGIVEILVV